MFEQIILANLINQGVCINFLFKILSQKIASSYELIEHKSKHSSALHGIMEVTRNVQVYPSNRKEKSNCFDPGVFKNGKKLYK
jgi:hypothetical protein